MEPLGNKVNEFVWWASPAKFYCLPKKSYTFWSKLSECRTWGDVRASYTKGFYRVLMNMYARSREETFDFDERKLVGKRFMDTKDFNPEDCNPGTYSNDMADAFPPYIECIQVASLGLHCGDLLEPYGEWITDFFGDEHLTFDGREMDKILSAIKEYGGECHSEPGLGQFCTMYARE